MLRRIAAATAAVIMSVGGGIGIDLAHSSAAGAASSPGYWLVARDGGIFSYGRGCLSRLDGKHAAEPADRVDDRAHRRQRLLVRGCRRWRVRLRLSLLRIHRRHGAEPAGGGDGGNPNRRRVLARGPTVASSPSATPASSARPVACGSTSRSPQWRQRRPAKRYWLVARDGGIFSLRGRHLPGLGRRCVASRPSSVWRRRRRATATRWWPATAACSPS